MSDLAKLSRWFRSQIGVAEDPLGSNNVIYNTLYYGRPVYGPQYGWCVAFVWAGFFQCGLSKLFLDGGKSAYCPYVVDWAKKHGLWVTGNYREGDILIFSVRGKEPDHMGYCLRKSGDALVCVEGNYGDRVSEVYRSVSEPLGAYRPDYGSEENGIRSGDIVEILPDARYWDNTVVPLWVKNKLWIVYSVRGERAVINQSLDGDFNIMSPISVDYLKVVSKPESGQYIEYRVKAGDSLWGIAQKDLGSGLRYKEIMEINGLTSTLIYPGQILKLPLE